MGNMDSFASAFAAQGTNKTLDFDGGYFSFAFGNEIALVLDGDFYILNCGYDLWNEVNEFLEQEKTLDEIITFWKEKSADYEISDWSQDFDELKA